VSQILSRAIERLRLKLMRDERDEGE